MIEIYLRKIKQHFKDAAIIQLKKEGKAFDPDYHPYINYNPDLLKKEVIQQKPKKRKKEECNVRYNERLGLKMIDREYVNENGAIIFDTDIEKIGKINRGSKELSSLEMQLLSSHSPRLNIEKARAVKLLYAHGMTAEQIAKDSRSPYKIRMVKYCISCFQ